MERASDHPADASRHDLLREYCRRAERELEQAPDRATAIRLAEGICAGLREECASSIIVNGTRDYLMTLIHARWQADQR